MSRPAHLLHVFSTFRPAGPQLRMAATINRLGNAEFTHTICAMDRNFEAAYRIDTAAASVRYQDPPPPAPPPTYLLAWRKQIAELRPDLVVTYNWGAIEALAGARLAGRRIVHNEHGFGPEEAVRLKRRRVWTRRILLRGAFRTIVPSKNLLGIAHREYRLPESRVTYIPSGIDVARFRPGLDRSFRDEAGARPGTILFGYVGLLREEKNLGLMMRAFAAAGIEDSKLVLVGDGASRPGLESLRSELGLGDRVVFAGTTKIPERFYSAFDVFLLSSTTEQMPMSMVEAMGCALPVLSTNVGDAADMLAATGAPEIVASQDLEAYTRALHALGNDAALRQRLGAKNRQLCEQRYALDRMVADYRAVYRAALMAEKPLT